MNVLPGEQIVSELKLDASRRLILTTHRVRAEAEGFGLSRMTSIMLEELCSCAITRLSSPAWLILAAILMIGGAVAALNDRHSDYTAAFGAAAVGLLCVLIYFLTRRQVASLESAGARIVADTSRVGVANVRQFIEQVEAAKNQRYLLFRLEVLKE
jgi:hypothetical protein